ncbi:cobalt transporter CbiM [Thermovibrio ammonificans]|jgi:cobalt/nickel transport system permease protein|uniref:Cobalamin (Vitamin B12) biosynthesis CbiM protein n=1 Tax=Thermovibrio ammonificans (strain DSM 15698 / JCM 12110 / HB-1) TaxID=648996 RepID=E8T4M8_THEA1|nr:cobalt transporter CbiM [Thermovibrio ammonificans]ADU97486.1 cobalamin (vitamin B12) biosynthesis CbiM protein [Thermovibrio ammonificans HB-1]
MHISEGVLPGWMLVTGWVLTAGGLALGLREINERKLPLVALLSATFFVASLVHLPIGVTSVHLLLNGLAGALLGWAVFPALFVALLFQAILFQFGGITVLGVNTFNMAFAGVVAYYLTRPFFRNPTKWKLVAAGVVAAFAGVFVAAFFLSVELYLAGSSFRSTAYLAFLAHIPVFVVEAIFNAFVFLFIYKNAPELLEAK